MTMPVYEMAWSFQQCCENDHWVCCLQPCLQPIYSKPKVSKIIRHSNQPWHLISSHCNKPPTKLSGCRGGFHVAGVLSNSKVWIKYFLHNTLTANGSFFITFICKILFFEPQNSSWFSNKGIFRYHRGMILCAFIHIKNLPCHSNGKLQVQQSTYNLQQGCLDLLKIILDTVYPRLAQKVCIILFWYWLILTLFHMVASIMTDCLYNEDQTMQNKVTYTFHRTYSTCFTIWHVCSPVNNNKMQWVSDYI